MDNVKNIVLGSAVVLVIVFGIMLVSRSPQILSPVETPPLGSVTGPDSFFNCEKHNGVQRCFARQVMTQATTTPCALKGPSATSTLVSAWANFIVSTSSATTLTLARDDTAYATTSAVLASTTLAANAQYTLIASTSPQAMFYPSQFVVLGVAGNLGLADKSVARFAPVGACGATFEVAQ